MFRPHIRFWLSMRLLIVGCWQILGDIGHVFARYKQNMGYIFIERLYRSYNIRALSCFMFILLSHLFIYNLKVCRFLVPNRTTFRESKKYYSYCDQFMFTQRSLVILTLISPQRKSSGMCSVSRSKSRSVGSAGRRRFCRWLAALTKLIGLGSLGQGLAVSSSRSTSLTMDGVGLNRFTTASFFVRAVILAAKAAPTLPSWLCGLLPKTKVLSAR